MREPSRHRHAQTRQQREEVLQYLYFAAHIGRIDNVHGERSDSNASRSSLADLKSYPAGSRLPGSGRSSPDHDLALELVDDIGHGNCVTEVAEAFFQSLGAQYVPRPR